MKIKQTKQTKGIGLFELIATLAIIAILVTVALPLLRGSVDDTTRLAWVQKQAKEMSQLKKAVAGWAALHEDTMAKDITISPAISEFIDSGLLPEKFAEIDPLNAATRGTPPLGGNYSVYLRNEKANGKYVLRGVIIDEGSHEQTKLLKAGMQSTSASGHNGLSRQWVSSVNLTLLDQFNMIGGLNPSGTKTATGSIDSFELDITDFVPTTNSQRARNVVFYGFAGIEGLHDPTAPPPPVVSNVSFCNMVLPVGMSDGFCPIGQIEMAKITVCDADLPTIIGIPEISAAVTWGYQVTEPVAFAASGIPSEYFGVNAPLGPKVTGVSYGAAYNDIHYYRAFSMNKAHIGRIKCAGIAWRDASYQNQPSSRPHGIFTQLIDTPNAAYVCTGYREKTYVVPEQNSREMQLIYDASCLANKDNILQLLKPGTAPNAVVCCLPN